MAKPGIQAEEPVFTFTLGDFLNNKEFVENEIVLTVEGRGVNCTTYTHVEEIVRKTAKLSKEEKIEEQFSCYRLEIPNRWYIRCKKEDLVEKLNNQTTKGKIAAEGSELTFRFQKKKRRSHTSAASMSTTQFAIGCHQETGRNCVWARGDSQRKGVT